MGHSSLVRHAWKSTGLPVRRKSSVASRSFHSTNWNSMLSWSEVAPLLRSHLRDIDVSEYLPDSNARYPAVTRTPSRRAVESACSPQRDATAAASWGAASSASKIPALTAAMIQRASFWAHQVWPMGTGTTPAPMARSSIGPSGHSAIFMAEDDTGRRRARGDAGARPSGLLLFAAGALDGHEPRLVSALDA